MTSIYYAKGFEDAYSHFGYDSEKLAMIKEERRPPGVSKPPTPGVPGLRFDNVNVAEPPKPPPVPTPKPPKPQKVVPVKAKNEPFQIETTNKKTYT